MFPSVTTVCALLTLSGFALAQTEVLPPGMQEVIRGFDTTASEAVKNPADTGYTLGVVTRNGLAWTKSYGQANAESDYRIGTGALTAIMLLQVTRDGKAHLSDAATKYVPELKAVHSEYPDAAPATLMQLALHSSGLEAGPGGAGPDGGWQARLLAALPQARYAFEPGTHTAFSPLEDAVLALALSRAVNQPYDAWLQQRILAPLGMSHTTFSKDGGDWNPALVTTIADVARLASFLMLGGPENVLSRSELEENYRRVWMGNSVAVTNPSEWFGIGYHGETWTSNHYYFIPAVGGSQPGFDAVFWFEPRRHAGVILLHHGAATGPLGQMIHTYVYTLNAQKVDAGRQDPVKPLPYTEEEVSFENKAAAIQLAGTLAIPQGTGPFPAVVLVPKAGPMDRDERLYNHRPFLVLADYLARAGIAVLRTDVRGVGRSGGKFPGSQADDFAGDAEAAMAYLKTRNEVNGRRVGLVSHGEGGTPAAIAAGRDGGAAFVVLLGAPAVPASENSVEGSRLSGEANGELPAKANEQAAMLRGMLALVAQESDADTLEKKLRQFLAGKLPEAQISAQMRQWTSAAFRKTMTYDPAAEFRKIACPVLALYADKDFAAPATLNVPAMRAALAANKSGVVEQLPDLNLLFQTTDTGIGREANWADETMSPAVMQKVAGWVKSQGER